MVLIGKQLSESGDNKFIGVGVKQPELSVLIISINKLNQNLDRLDAQPILIILT